MSENVEGQQKLHDGRWHWEEHLTGSQKRWMKESGHKWVTLGASVGVSLGLYPVDSIKTRMQTYGFSGVRSCFSYARKTEGWSFLYRGSFVPITSQAVTRAGNWGLYFTCRDAIDPTIASWTGTRPTVKIVTEKGAAPTWMVPLTMGISGAMTGATFAVISAPSEFAKIVSQVDCLRALDPNKPITKATGTVAAQRGMGSIDAAKDMIRRRGPFSLFTGLKYHMYRDTIGSAFYFALWEPWKLFVNMPGRDHYPNFMTDFAGGAGCGTISLLAAYALDTAKNRYQRDFIRAVHSNGPRPSYPPLSLRTLLKNPRIYAVKYGLIAFKPPPRLSLGYAAWISRDSYAGTSMLIVRSIFSNGLFMASVEEFRRQLDALKLDPDERVLH